MKKMKTLLALSLALVMVFALIACGGGDSNNQSDPNINAIGEEETNSYIDAILYKGELRVGVKSDVLGFGYLDPASNNYSGMEIDLAQKLADSLGVELELTTVTAATRTELLDSGDIDCVLATFTINESRKQNWDFTTPYYTDYITVLVEDSSGITTLEDLLGKTVGVSSGSNSAQSLVEAMIEAGLISGGSYSTETFDPATWHEGVDFSQFEDYPAISTALSAGQVDAFCVDKSILAVYKTEGRSYIEAQFAPQEYGIATMKGTDFSAYCEQFIQDCFADGTIDELIAQYELQ